MLKFFGVSIVMGNLRFPRIRMYWQRATKVDTIANALPVNRYFQLRSNLHVNAARDPHPENKFWKVQPVVDAVRDRCRKLPREEFTSVDEQLIPFTGRVPAKQFIKSKPNPVGVKNFVICGKSGRAQAFELYQDAGTGIPDDTKHLGLGALVVLRLAETTPKQKNHKVCFDNYFTGMRLIRELKMKGIHSVGVVKSNRFMGCVLKTEKELKKEGRGSMDSKISDEGDISVVRWLDNLVTLASSFVGIDEKDKVRRWKEKDKVSQYANGIPKARKARNDVADVLVTASVDQTPTPTPPPYLQLVDLGSQCLRQSTKRILEMDHPRVDQCPQKTKQVLLPRDPNQLNGLQLM